MPKTKTKLRTMIKANAKRAKPKRAKAKRGLPPSTFGDSRRGKREKFRNRGETMCRKTLEIYRKCGTHAVTIIEHPVNHSLLILNTRKGSGSVWPSSLQDFLATTTQDWIRGPDDFAKSSETEEDDSDLTGSYRSWSYESEESSRENLASTLTRRTTGSRPILQPLSPTLGGPSSQGIEPWKLIKNESIEDESLTDRTRTLARLPVYEEPKSLPRGVRNPELKLIKGPRTPPQIRLGPLSPTLLIRGAAHHGVSIKREDLDGIGLLRLN